MEVTPAIKEHVQSKGLQMVWSNAHSAVSFASTRCCVPVCLSVICLLSNSADESVRHERGM